jgi:hypothetical protein
MSRFVHLLRTPDARYAIGAAVSWPIYGALYIAVLKIFDRHYAAAAEFHGYFRTASFMRFKNMARSAL